MLRLSLFLLLSLLLHLAGWQLLGAPGVPPSEVAQAPQVLRLGGLVQLAPAEPPASPPRTLAPAKARPARKADSASVVARKPRERAVERAPRPASVVAAPAAPASPVAAPPSAAPVPSAALAAAADPEPAPVQAISPAQPVEVLSHKPSFRRPPQPPHYPAQARRRNQQGTVLLEVRLDKRGQQRGLAVLRSSGIASLDRAALEAVAAWRFNPQQHNGVAVPSRVQIPIEFALTASR
ncbi:energy transducer TonB [Pseudomonas xionganensis]|uniref:TonB family protein n=1 Tax=Pseudomonas xionganensis TaxID=2654845 RepID=A0A6I4KV82_9PSED|nr:energy transducer TonB [Pseudomonas xionganensis]MVW76629.1 TonB family protein [Pseudomonas xionganensis]